MNYIRPKDDRRSRKRAEVRARKEEEKKKKMEEIARLKALKLKEIQEKIAKLKEVTGNDDLAFKVLISTYFILVKIAAYVKSFFKKLNFAAAILDIRKKKKSRNIPFKPKPGVTTCH